MVEVMLPIRISHLGLIGNSLRLEESKNSCLVQDGQLDTGVSLKRYCTAASFMALKAVVREVLPEKQRIKHYIK